MENFKDIFGFLYLCYKNKWLILTGGITTALLVFLYSYFFITPVYTASIQLYVRNSETEIMSSYNGSDANAAKSLVNTCMIILKDDEVLQQAADIINAENENVSLNGAAVKKMLQLSQVNTSEIMRIEVISDNPNLAARLCNILAYEVAPEVMERVIGFSPARPLSEAKPPAKPSSPNSKKHAAYGGMIGIITVFIIVVIRSLLDDTIKNELVIKEHFELPLLGQIPEFMGKNEKKKKFRREHKKKMPVASARLSDETPFAIKEAYKGLRSSLSYVLGASNTKVIIVSSPGPGESKSTTSSNLAITIAESGKKVLLIDADMRKPVQHRIFSVRNKVGLSSLLAEIVRVRECIQKDVRPNLDLLPAGPHPPNPSELLGTSVMTALLDAAEKLYDVVVIDTPPINVVSDVFCISSETAGVLLVSRYGETTVNALQSAVSSVELSKMSILGVVITGWSTEAGSYRKYYAYQYSDASRSETGGQ